MDISHVTLWSVRPTHLASSMATRRALHFVFKIADRNSTIKFYREILGMKVRIFKLSNINTGLHMFVGTQARRIQ